MKYNSPFEFSQPKNINIMLNSQAIHETVDWLDLALGL